MQEPFWGIFLLGLNKQTTRSIPTMAVAKAGLGIDLLINPDFWDSLSDTEQQAILLHELHHICFGHIFMGPDFEDHEKFNIACDAEVNCYIQGLPPDDGHVDVVKLGLPPNQGAKWYYEHLAGQQIKAVMPGGQNGGSGQGQEPKPNGKTVVKVIDDHTPWRELSRASQSTREIIRDQIEGMLKQAAIQTMKSRGTIPGHLKGLIDDLLKERPRIYDWRAHLRRALGTEIDLKLKKTYQRTSKRFPGSPGLRFKKKVSVLIGIDTSGSVSNQSLSEFFSEIHHIYKAGARIHVIECDAAITSEWDYKGLQNIAITGRGGTNFRPLMDYYRAHQKEYVTFAIFTDGEAPVDNLDPPHNRVLWVITPDGKRQVYPGKVIYMPKSQE